VGVYDAPLRYKSEDAVPLTELSQSIAEQIKQIMNAADAVVLSIRAPQRAEEDENEPKV